MILYNILFLVIWITVGAILVYTRAHLKYDNKKRIDECYNERSQLKEENEQLKATIKKMKEEIKQLKKELEKAKREIMEKNKYLSEDKVVIERLYEVKKLSDQISNILTDYDKETIKHLLEEYKKWELCEVEKELAEKEDKKFNF